MKRIVALLTWVVFLATAALAQAPTGPPKPGPEHKRLSYFVGNWIFEGEAKPGPFGPGGKVTATETNEWFPGEFFLISHSEEKGPMGVAKSLSLMGYSTEEKAYTLHMISSTGPEISSRGKVDGDTWTWTTEMKMGGKTYSGRFTIKEQSPTFYTVKLEVSTDGGPFVVQMEGKETKK